MREIKPSDRHTILNNHTNFNKDTLCFWYNEINSRLKYLNPLLEELESKGMDLKTVSKELAQELFEITELKKILEMYKVYNYSCECGLKTNDYLEWKKCYCKSNKNK